MLESKFFEHAAKLFLKATPNLDIPRGKKCCPYCGGRGGRNETPGGGFALNPGNRMYWRACGYCNGSGEIPA